MREVNSWGTVTVAMRNKVCVCVCASNIGLQQTSILA